MRSQKMFWLMILGVAALACYPSEAHDTDGKRTGGMEGCMSMMDRMEKSDQTCRMTADTLDKVMKNMREARKSGDKARMRAAMESAETHMMTMKEHMERCMGRMDSGMMDMKGMKGEKAPKPESKATSDTADHAKHHPAK